MLIEKAICALCGHTYRTYDGEPKVCPACDRRVWKWIFVWAGNEIRHAELLRKYDPFQWDLVSYDPPVDRRMGR